MLKLLQLEGFTKRPVTQLSGGQRQRVALGRALAVDPHLLLLDEPMSNLDYKVRLELRHELRALQRRIGITAVYVTHDREEALMLADRIAVIDAGRVVQFGRARGRVPSAGLARSSQASWAPTTRFRWSACPTAASCCRRMRRRAGDRAFSKRRGARGRGGRRRGRSRASLRRQHRAGGVRRARLSLSRARDGRRRSLGAGRCANRRGHAGDGRRAARCAPLVSRGRSDVATLAQFDATVRGAHRSRRHDVRTQIMGQGWIPEGLGIGVVACLPP